MCGFAGLKTNSARAVVKSVAGRFQTHLPACSRRTKSVTEAASVLFIGSQGKNFLVTLLL